MTFGELYDALLVKMGSGLAAMNVELRTPDDLPIVAAHVDGKVVYLSDVPIEDARPLPCDGEFIRFASKSEERRVKFMREAVASRSAENSITPQEK